jgi:ATP-dependent exoDNAse (exonuclease V) beta subunit
VGDPKQSIYRFRRADVAVYQEAKAQLEAAGAATVFLTTSFRATPRLQHLVNAAFAPWIRSDRGSLQADYVPLARFREDRETQPAVVALPVPEPYGFRGTVTRTAVDASLPRATAAFLHWLLAESGWTVTERERPGERVPVAPRHICLLFRRLHEFFSGDVTRPYLDALEGRGIPHLLVGGRSFHVREEVEAIRTVLAAIEWPDDELAVFATLRGSLFAIGDEELLEYRDRYRRVHPYRIPGEALPEPLRPIGEALHLLRRLHEERNGRPIAETILLLLEETRAHASFVLRPSGEQALANVLHVAELARRYESTGGISFRGFLDRLLEEAEEGRAPEAPILEDGSEGVRVMTVHKAKGLEFPIVVLADPSCPLASRQAGRFLDAARGLCAMRIAGWSPRELQAYGRIESARDQAEGVRLAYVAATRARDLLVVRSSRRRAGWPTPAGSRRSPTRSIRRGPSGRTPRRRRAVPRSRGMFRSSCAGRSVPASIASPRSRPGAPTTPPSRSCGGTGRRSRSLPIRRWRCAAKI